MDKEEKRIGSLSYTGKSVKDGLLDARKAAEALEGFDEILRYFLIKEDPVLARHDFEIPVRVKKGSLIIEILEKILSPGGAFYSALTVYMSFTAKKAAEDGFLNTGAVKDIKKTFRVALKSAQWVIRIGTHLGSLTKKKIEGARIKPTDQGVDIEIPDANGKFLTVPKKYLDLYSGCPEKLFSKCARVVEQERTLELAVVENGIVEKVSITERNKAIFHSEADEEVLFPELKHGQTVVLDGRVTRGNEKTNTIGFEYLGHILTCRPASGNIVEFKNKIISQLQSHIFPPIKIIGVIDRLDDHGELNEKRPLIIFSDITLSEEADEKLSLFENK